MDNIKTVDVILKSGAVITVKCGHCTVNHYENELTKCSFEGIPVGISDYPLYIRIDDISAVVQHGINEKEQNNADR